MGLAPRAVFVTRQEQIQFGRKVIPNLTLPGNPGSNLILVTEIEIQFVFPDESRKLPRIQLRGNIFLRRLSVASFAIDHPSWGQTFFFFDAGLAYNLGAPHSVRIGPLAAIRCD
jgi:hypothetical protein